MTATPPPPSRTTAAFYAQAGISFAVSVFAVACGIAWLPVPAWPRAFLEKLLAEHDPFAAAA